MRIRIILTVFLFILLRSQFLVSQTLDNLFEKYETSEKVYGTVELMKDNQILYRKSIGWQNSKEKKKNDSLTVYPIGWITELFVQTLFIQLMEEGKLKLSDKLSKYYSEIPNSNKITLENLLRHTSGFPNIDSIQMNNTREKVMHYLQKHPDLNRTKYSKANYLLLGFIVEDVSGKSFEELLQTRIISKIGLKNTFYEIKPSKEQLASSYYKKGEFWRKSFDWNVNSYKTTAGIYSNPHDLNVFISALYQGELFSQKNVDKYMKEEKYKNKMGLYVRKGEPLKLYSFGIKNKGLQIYLRYLDKDKVSVCVILNANDNMNPDFISNGLLDFYYNKPIKIPNFSLIDHWKEE